MLSKRFFKKLICPWGSWLAQSEECATLVSSKPLIGCRNYLKIKYFKKPNLSSISNFLGGGVGKKK